ncbi:MAG: ComEC/Rec2 family competence protein [Faecalibacterium sp.]
MRSAYRGAGLAHVLVVSGMHVSILCGEVFRLHCTARKKEQRYRRRRRLRRYAEGVCWPCC